MPSFRQVLEAVAALWRDRRDDAVGAGARLGRAAGRRRRRSTRRPSRLTAARWTRRRRAGAEPIDARNGGFGGAPKFPPHCALELLAARGEREMPAATLRAMARGGICDQVGGGFSRYAVDATWTVPHFEKMLYDNALLARAYLRALAGRRGAAVRAHLPRDARVLPARAAGARKEASTPRSTRIPRASRVASTSGASPSCATSSARWRPPRSPTSAPASRATSTA